MSWNFDNEVRKMKRKEIKSLYKELEENNESYYQDALNEGYDNTHDYEARINFRFILFACIIITLVVGGVCYAMTL
jgi:hypothetical protein